MVRGVGGYRTPSPTVVCISSCAAHERKFVRTPHLIFFKTCGMISKSSRLLTGSWPKCCLPKLLGMPWGTKVLWGMGGLSHLWPEIWDPKVGSVASFNFHGVEPPNFDQFLVEFEVGESKGVGSWLSGILTLTIHVSKQDINIQGLHPLPPEFWALQN